MPIHNLDFEVAYNKSAEYSLGVTVKNIKDNTLVLHTYLLSCHLREVPKTYGFALNAILNAPNTPKDILGKINNEYQRLTLNKNSLLLGSKLIESLEVDNFSNLEYNRLLWENKLDYDFNEKTILSDYSQLMQADIKIKVKDVKLIAHINLGEQWKITSESNSVFWHLENHNKDPKLYKSLYKSSGGKWFIHQGEIGSAGIRKPMKGMSVYYTKIPSIIEKWVNEQLAEGYQIEYKNYDTKFHIEEEIREQIAEEKINANKSTSSEQAFEAIKNKDVNSLKTILEKGEHPDHLKNQFDQNALHHIGGSYTPLEKEHFEMFKLLLAYGADPNLDKFSPLIHDMCYWRKEIFGDKMLKLLIKHKADINSFNEPDKNSLLQSSAANGRLWLVQLLISKGADINYKDKKESSALISAINYNHSTIETIQYLLDNGADKSELHALHNDNSILDRVVTSDRTDILKYLISTGVDINAKSKYGEPAIFKCAEYGPAIMLNEVIALGANMDDTISNVIYRIEIRMTDKRLDKNTNENALEKLKVLHKRGFPITDYTNILSSFVEKISSRKKMKKFEETIILSLLEMGYKHDNENVFLEYLNRVNNLKILSYLQKS